MVSAHEAGRLHYIYDPFCGWCYAASPLIQAAQAYFPVTLHAGGMLSDSQRQPVTPQLRRYVMAHDQRIAAISGQPFGAAYFDGLLCDPQACLDSTPPIAAVLAAETQAGQGLALLARLQQAHYVQGLRIADVPVLVALAQALGLAGDFAAAMRAVPVAQHIAASRRLLAEHGGSGFPTLLLQQGEEWRRLDLSQWLGRVEDWRQWLQEISPLAAAEPGLGQCDLTGCALPAAPNGMEVPTTSRD